ncbi:phasin family protein [Sinirhodobacter huangdaonensis]|uniref:Phasin family protein n=1 Tax=Paenirhodobacter huangdaonensis TaxID=2501515 RepID=A0A3S3LJF9_9RHOB|nr:phasin family protein [Sinirhodobacter huangdaonensis]RWR48845.1 phasin family protein [Sinirhodobacter huangdaonensis]
MPTKTPPSTITFASMMKAPSAETWTMFMKPQARMAESLLKHNIEMLEFLKARFERDREMLDELADAGSPAEAMAMWQGFWQKMLTDYSVETNKLAASATEIAEQAIRAATEEGEAMVTAAGGKSKD